MIGKAGSAYDSIGGLIIPSPADHFFCGRVPFVFHWAPEVKRESCVMPFKDTVSSSERVVRLQLWAVVILCYTVEVSWVRGW